jgi:hypothetical protein
LPLRAEGETEGPRLYDWRLGDVAQLVEHLLCKQGVGGSSPLVSTGNRKPILTSSTIPDLDVDTLVLSFPRQLVAGEANHQGAMR